MAENKKVSIPKEKYDELIETLDLVSQLPDDAFSILTLFIDRETGKVYYSSNTGEKVEPLFAAIVVMIDDTNTDSIIDNILGTDKIITRH